MEPTQSPPPIVLTPATQGDAEFLYSLWDKTARTASFSGGPRDLDCHVQWLKDTLADPNRHVFVATERGIAVGAARLDVFDVGRWATVSLNVAPAHRRRGIGVAILRALEAEARELKIETLRAEMKLDNVSSQGAFTVAGYGPPEWSLGSGSRCLMLRRL